MMRYYLLGACTAGFTLCFTPVNVCVVDAKIHSQAVCEVHGVSRAANRLMKFLSTERQIIYQVSV